ncbi:MAG: GNAT family N-acetyltransferase [Verrucomicrobiota bacterium]|nr:GNAT family N-acetyltransferase [Verrucomicrobiota bacterium]
MSYSIPEITPHLNLSGLWKFKADPANLGETHGYFASAFKDTYWREVAVPCCVDLLGKHFEDYEGHGWFRRMIHVPSEWAGRRLRLHFAGVNYHTKVWVNGQLAGSNGYGHLPFVIDSDAWVFGACNTLAIQTDNLRVKGELPGFDLGWRSFGGLHREVYLVAEDRCHFTEAWVDASLAGAKGDILVNTTVRNERNESIHTTQTVRVLDAAGLLLHTSQRVEDSLEPGDERRTGFSARLESITAWTADTPVLYTVELTLEIGDQVAERRLWRTGFRHVTTYFGKVFLNSQPLFLTGFNRHEDSPSAGMATDLACARQDLMAMKATGANCVRLCHYPHHPGVLDLCDELGLLVMAELPLYWWNGYEEGREAHEHKAAAAAKQLRLMIDRDRHHPSIIFWSVSNESREMFKEVADGNASLVALAREIDSSRLAVHVSEFWQAHPHFEEDDVICINNYPSVWAHPDTGDTGNFARCTEYWKTHLEKLHEAYPEKAILITEFGHASYAGENGGMMGENTAASSLQAQLDGMTAPYICGALVWCWADHAWPAHQWPHMARTRQSPFGVVTRDRRPKAAHWAIRDAFLKIQGRLPAPQPANDLPNLGPAGYEIYMVRDHLRDIPVAPFPAGYGIRTMHPGDASLWVDVWRDAEEYFTIADNAFVEAFGSDWEAVPRRCYLITDPKGRALGTISGWYNRHYHGIDYGQVHWVANRPAARGMGLAKAALAHTMHQLAQWHERAYLGTQTKRIPAIKLYLAFGFRPDLDHPGARIAWSSIVDALPELKQWLGES